MKSLRFLAVLAAITVLCVLFSVAAIAQQGKGGSGNGPGNNQPPPPPPVIKAGADGVFVLTSGALYKLEADTLTQVGSLQLIEKQATQGKGSQTGNQQQAPPAGGAMIVAAGKVLVVIGDQFFSIDATSLEIVAKTTLPKPSDGQNVGSAGTRSVKGKNGQGGQGSQGGQGNGQQGPPPPATLELQGTTLYVAHGPQIIAVNIDDGTILGQATLPKPADQTSK